MWAIADSLRHRRLGVDVIALRPIMIIALAVAFRLFVSPRLVAEARRQADRGRAGSMEGHAAMDMSIAGHAQKGMSGSFTVS